MVLQQVETTLVSLGLVYFGFQKNSHFVKVWKNKFDKQETAGKVQQSIMEFAAVTSKNPFAISLQRTPEQYS